MELKEGMHVRFKDKRNIEYIRQIVEIPKDKRFASIYLDKEANYSRGLSFKNVIKASYNIIDLIEVGDYVNGYNVSATYLEGTNHYIKLENEYTDGKRIYNKDIESIVTKEQFESMSYKVGE